MPYRYQIERRVVVGCVVSLSLLPMALSSLPITLRRRRQVDPQESYAVMLNRLSANDRQHVLDPDEPGEFTFSGAEIDPDTGNAFFYKTTEEVKTITEPVDGDNGTGFTTRTTRLITDEKHWLIKAEPEPDTFLDDTNWAHSDLLEAEFGAIDVEEAKAAGLDPFLDDFSPEAFSFGPELSFEEDAFMDGLDAQQPRQQAADPNSYIGAQWPARGNASLPPVGSAQYDDDEFFLEYRSYLLKRV